MASLRGFGSANRESLAELVWAFFEYWAWRHNYSGDVVSIRLGACLHKDDKDWTRRIGNERHLVGGASGSWVRAVETAGLPASRARHGSLGSVGAHSTLVASLKVPACLPLAVRSITARPRPSPSHPLCSLCRCASRTRLS